MTQKNGSIGQLRNIIVADDTNYKVNIAVWGRLAAIQFTKGKIVAFRDAVVN